MVKEKSPYFYFLYNFFFLLFFFFILRVYLLFSGNVGGKYSFTEVLPGFLEDAFLAILLAVLTYLALAVSKWLFFIFVFPLELFVIITTYSNLQYVNFFRENLRLFDLEYLRNFGDLWKSTATDMRLHAGEFLFIALPLLVFLALIILIIVSKRKKISLKKGLIFLFVLFLFSSHFYYVAYRLQDKKKRRAFQQSNFFVWMIRDIPRIKNLIQMTSRLKETKIEIQRKESSLDYLDLKGLTTKKTFSENLSIQRRPYSLPDDYVWYDEGYPFIKIPRRDAYLLRPSSTSNMEQNEKSDFKTFVPRNVVFLILEGFRCREIDTYGGLYSITPNFNELASKSILFENFYCHGDMTARALFPSLTSFYDSFRGVCVTREHPYNKLFSLPEILQLFGYSNSYINSWSANFDNLGSFFNVHGKFNVVDKALFPLDGEMAGWAHSDEEIMRLAVKTMDKAKKPFFSIVLTATNHIPYDLPSQRFDLRYETGIYSKFLNTFHYTDYSLGFFFKLLRTRKYFKDTLFFIFADTGSDRQKKKAEFTPPLHFDSMYHVPLLIYDPLKEEGKVVEEISGQIDLAPTVLDLLGIEIANHFVGESLMKKRASPFYLSYHGRDDPRAYYVDNSFLSSLNTDTKDMDVFDRESGLKIKISTEKQAGIVSSVQDLVKLTDWAIFSDRIWDERLTEFYKRLYVRKKEE